MSVARGLYGVPVVSAGPYRGVRRAVVLSLKERGRWKLASALVTRAAYQQVKSIALHHPDPVVVPVPSSRQGSWRRGYAPTTLIARCLGRYAQIPVIEGLHLRPSGLGEFVFTSYRRRNRSRSQRLNRTQALFRVGALPPNSTVVLVDDVMATGATLEAAAMALRQRGHRVVLALVVADVPQKQKTLISSIATSDYPGTITLTRRT